MKCINICGSTLTYVVTSKKENFIGSNRIRFKLISLIIYLTENCQFTPENESNKLKELDVCPT